MAIGQRNYPNISPPDGDYPDGRIKDNPGDGSGTPINQLTNGDIQEFFAKLLRLQGVAPSGNPENEYSGHQYIDALTALLDSEWTQSTDKTVVDVSAIYGMTVDSFYCNYKQTYRDIIYQFEIVVSYSGSPVAPVILITVPYAAKQIASSGFSYGSCSLNGAVTATSFPLILSNINTPANKIEIQSSHTITTDSSINITGEIRYEKATPGHS